MIVANKSPWLDRCCYLYLRRALRRTFHSVLISGRSHLTNLEPTCSVLACSNHTNWWDGLMVFFLTRQAAHKAFYCMMEEKQLQHYRFFCWLGAFSVDLDNSLKAAGAVRYALRLLRKPANLVWVFPQGRLATPYEPFEPRPGAAFLAFRMPGNLVLPVAFRYEFFREDRPVALIRVGAPFPSAEATDERLKTEIQQLEAELEEVVRSRNPVGFEFLLRPRWTINKRWEWVRLAATGRLKEFRAEN